MFKHIHTNQSIISQIVLGVSRYIIYRPADGALYSSRDQEVE